MCNFLIFLARNVQFVFFLEVGTPIFYNCIRAILDSLDSQVNKITEEMINEVDSDPILLQGIILWDKSWLYS